MQVLLVATCNQLVQQLKRLTIQWWPNSLLTLDLIHRLQNFRVYLHRKKLLNMKQVTVDTFFGRSGLGTS